ncbi:hypothetical protein ACLBWX_05065 [Methylobacterium sp. M6A4_1b]
MQQTVKRELPPVALKIGTDALVEKSVRFQDQNFHEKHSATMSLAIKKLSYSRKSDVFAPVEFLSSIEMQDLYQVYEDFFWWRPGSYSLHFSIKSPNGAKLVKESYIFTLSQEEVYRLKSNLDVIRTDSKNIVMAGQEDFEAKAVFWHWSEPKMTRLA